MSLTKHLNSLLGKSMVSRGLLDAAQGCGPPPLNQEGHCSLSPVNCWHVCNGSWVPSIPEKKAIEAKLKSLVYLAMKEVATFRRALMCGTEPISNSCFAYRVENLRRHGCALLPPQYPWRRQVEFLLATHYPAPSPDLAGWEQRLATKQCSPQCGYI